MDRETPAGDAQSLGKRIRQWVRSALRWVDGSDEVLCDLERRISHAVLLHMDGLTRAYVRDLAGANDGTVFSEQVRLVLRREVLGGGWFNAREKRAFGSSDGLSDFLDRVVGQPVRDYLKALPPGRLEQMKTAERHAHGGSAREHDFQRSGHASIPGRERFDLAGCAGLYREALCRGFFAALSAECPGAGVGRAPGTPAATLYASTPTMRFNPSYAVAVQVLKANEIARYLGATKAEDDARDLAKASGCNPVVVKRVISDMTRHLSDRQWAGPSAAILAAQCKSRPNRWDGSPCDCIASALDLASTPRSRQLLMSDFWGWMENLIDGDSRLYNLSMVACTKTAMRTDERKPSYVRSEKFLHSSSAVIRTALSTMIQFERITLPSAVTRPLYEHAAPLWAEHGEPTRLLECYYGSNSQAADTFAVLFWQNTVFLSRADFAAISPRHPLMLVSEMVRKTCPEIDEAREIRAANHREARKLGYH